MPELPEVETINRQLSQKITGKKIKEIKVLRKKNFKGDKSKVIGQKITAVRRQAKVIIIDLNNNFHLLIHLKMTGQLIFRKKLNAKPPYNRKPKGNTYNIDLLPNKYTRVIISFDDNTHLLFNNLRAFGWVKVIDNQNIKNELENFSGVDPLSKKFTVDYLKKIAEKTSRSIKLLLMDQSKIGGIGNIYASEALFCARIHPKTKSKKVAQKKKKVIRLHNCIIKVLKKALKHKGSTANDDAFRDTSGNRGKMQQHLKVYAREGEKCPECGDTIKRIKISGRSSFFCPSCQKRV
jgi:formamidopyrimidine-DNA glycosylase